MAPRLGISLSLAAALAVHSFAYSYEVKMGWNLLGATENIVDFTPFAEAGTMVFKYSNNQWTTIQTNAPGTGLQHGEGFWFIADHDATVTNAESEESEPTDIPEIPTESEAEETPSSESQTTQGSRTFNLPDTGQDSCYSSYGTQTGCSNSGQDGATTRNAPSYTDNGNETVTDNVTGLIWTKSADTNSDGTINVSDKLSQSSATSYCSNLDVGGYSDWRLPDIKQMYSLIDFSGWDISMDTGTRRPFVDSTVFDFAYGDESAGERTIDAQWATTTIYKSTTMGGNETMFGVNLADGRIKGYPTNNKTYYVYCVRGNESYGQNNFADNGDGTVTDSATGLMWQQDDSGSGMEWDSAISSCENDSTAGHSDWRLPNAKELQSIIDYTRSPDTHHSAAIDPVFNSTMITNEAGEDDWGFYWTSTTHISGDGSGNNAAYLSFGRALGYWNNDWSDVHGAGAQRSDPKVYPSGQSYYSTTTSASGETVYYNGPQGDVLRSYNYVRCVRDAE